MKNMLIYNVIVKINSQIKIWKFHNNTKHRLIIQTLGSDLSQKGSGKAMFNQLLDVAAKKGKGIEVTATQDASGFYKKMGMNQVSVSDFELSAEEVKRLHKQLKSK
jgi:hypothetical protein